MRSKASVGVVDGKLRIVAHAHMRYIYICIIYFIYVSTYIGTLSNFHNLGVHGRFGLSLKRNGRLRKQAVEIARLVMKKMTADSKSKGYTRDLHGQSLSGRGCWSYFVTKLA